MKIYILDTGCNEHDFFRENNININFIDDKNGHGTQVSGIISNIAPKEEYHMIKCMNDNGKGSVSQIVEAIEEAIDNNADIILMSIGIDKNKEELYKVIKKAVRKKIYIISSAGNVPHKTFYPANYDEVISVGSLKCDGNIAPWSCLADIYAGGVNIVAPSFNNLYSKVTGTSFSTAIVCGYMILLIKEFENQHHKKPTKNQVLKILREVFPYVHNNE